MDTRGGGSEQKGTYPGSILPANVETFGASPRVVAEGVLGGQVRTGERGGRRMLSAKRVVALLVVGLAAVALLVPLQLHRPAWIEAEAVLGVWWTLWAVLLTWLLYVGVGLHDDLTVSPGTTADDGARWWHSIGWLDPGQLGEVEWLGADALGCLMPLVVLLLLGVFIVLGVMLTEVVLPLVVPLGYAVVLWMLTRVLHHHPACHRNLARSLGLGVWWATVYTAPLAVAVVAMHVLL